MLCITFCSSLHPCVYVPLHVCVCVCVCLCLCLCQYVCVHVWMSVCERAHGCANKINIYMFKFAYDIVTYVFKCMCFVCIKCALHLVSVTTCISKVSNQNDISRA